MVAGPEYISKGKIKINEKVVNETAPKEVDNNQVNVFVDGFIEAPAMNFFKVKIKNDRITNEEGLDLAITEGNNLL